MTVGRLWTRVPYMETYPQTTTKGETMTMTDTPQRRTDAEWHKAGYEAGLEWQKFTMAHVIEEIESWTAKLQPGCVADEFTVGILQGLAVALKGKHHVA